MHGHSLIDTWYRRLPRYLFIEEHLHDQVVVELGCGQGVGADFVAERGAAKVHAFDSDERQVLKARARYQRPNLSFQVLEDRSVPLPDGTAEVVLVPEAAPFLQDPEWLAEIRRVLAPGGLCLLAAPNGDLEEPEPDAVAYYDLLQALEAVFPSVSMAAQTPLLGFSFVDFVAPAEELELSFDASLAEDLVDDVAYYVALCSAGPVAPSLYVITQVPFAPVARRLQALLEDGPVDQMELAELREALTAEREERIVLGENAESLRRELVESQGMAGQLRAGLSALRAEYDALEDRLGAVQGELEQAQREGGERQALSASLREAEEALGAARGDLERLQDEQARLHLDREAHRAAVRQAEDQLEALRQEVSSRSEQVAEQETALEAAERQIAELRQQCAEKEHLAVRLSEANEELARATAAQAVEAERRREAEVALEASQAAVTVLQASHDRVEQALSDATRGREECENARSALSREREDLREQVARQEAALATSEGRCQALEGDLETRTRRAHEAEASLVQALSTASERAVRLSELEGALSDAERRRAELDTERESLRRQTDELQHRLGEVERNRGELETDLGRAREEGQAKDGRLSELEQRLGEAEWRRGELEAELGRVREESQAKDSRLSELEWYLGEARGALGSVEGERETLRAELHAAREERAELGRQLADRESALETERGRVSALGTELERAREEARLAGIAAQEELQKVTQAADTQAMELAAERDESQAALADRQKTCADLEARAESVEREREEWQARAVALERELEASRADQRSLEVRLQQSQSAAASAQREVEGQQARADALAGQLDQLRSELTRSLTSQESAADAIRGELESARAERVRAEAEAKESRRLLAEAEGKALRSEAELRNQLDDLREKVEQMESQAGEARRGAEERGQRAAALEGQLGEARREAEERGRRAVELEGQLGEARQGGEALSRRVAELEWLLGEARQGAEEQGRRVGELERRLAEEGEARQALGGKVAGMEGALSGLRDQTDQHQARVAELTDALEEARRAHTEAERRAQSVRDEMTRDLEATRARAEERDRERLDLLALVQALQHRADGLADALSRARDAASAAAVARQEIGREVEAAERARDHAERALAESRRELEVVRSGEPGETRERTQPGAAREVTPRPESGKVEDGERVAALEAALVAERATRQEVERNLEGLESSLAELTRLGNMAVAELDAARQESANHAAQVEAWRARCEELRTQLEAHRGVDVPPEGASDAEVQALRDRLRRTQADRQEAEAEKARLQRLARDATGERDQLASAMEAAREVQDQATAGMALVIARLESERERADALEREAATLRAQLRDRTDRIVLLTREAAAEADRARNARRELAAAKARLAGLEVGTAATAERPVAEPEPTVAAPASADSSLEVESLAARLEERTEACLAAEARVRAQAEELAACSEQLEELRRGQSAGQHRLVALEAEWRVAGWDRSILEDRLETLLREREPLVDANRALALDLEEVRAREERLTRHVEEFREGALRHRREMADREVALAEHRAWNEEMQGELTALREALAHGEEERDALGRSLAEVDARAKLLGAQRARLQGQLEQCERELASAHGDGPSAVPTDHRLEAELQKRASRIEDLEAILGSLRAERKTLRERCGKQDEELTRLRSKLETEPGSKAPDARLGEARRRLAELESICSGERARLGELAEDLQRAMGQAEEITRELGEERTKAKRLSEEKVTLERRAARVLELELELDTLRSQPSSAPRELLTQLQALGSQLSEQREATEQARERVRSLNNVIGDREAEVLLLNAQMERLQRQVSHLLGEVREALRDPSPPVDALRALLGKLGGELELLI